jgi:hypothetical protein
MRALQLQDPTAPEWPGTGGPYIKTEQRSQPGDAERLDTCRIPAARGLRDPRKVLIQERALQLERNQIPFTDQNKVSQAVLQDQEERSMQLRVITMPPDQPALNSPLFEMNRASFAQAGG